ncbi:hypothetical protein G9A89_014810 [Geosiphon pyriformis]|nr:hypothetical protein G9A89_014810 [Geosiphon pyriformis]
MLRKKLDGIVILKTITITIESLLSIPISTEIKIAFEHQIMSLLFIPTQKTSTNKHHPKVAELENIGANHLGFAKFLFQHYCQYLGLNHNYISTKLAFNFYVNKKIFFLLGTPVNTESARETFYRELIQNTNLPTNHNFTSIITKINKEIEHHTQQKYPITYTSKDKGKLQTPAVTLKKIQPLTWKKTKVESPTNPSYHYTPRSAINILSTGASTSNVTSTFRQFPFQKLSKEEEEEELEDQEFTYQNPIIENPEIQQPLVSLQQPPQPNLDPMAYAPITKLEKFTGEEDNAQAWINDVAKAITANNWDDARIMQVIPYFLKDMADSCDNNSINCLTSTFTIIKQGDTEVVTTYLEHFHRNLCQIQAIQTDYFTASQILNQFIRELHSIDLSTAMTHVRDFEAAKLEANHAQAVNLVMNGSSNLDSKLKQFSDNINQKLEDYLPCPSFPANQQWQQEMHVCHYCATSRTIPTLTSLCTNNAAINVLTTSISSSNLLTAATSNLLTTTAANNISTSTNSNTAPKLTTQWNTKTKNDSTELEIGDGGSSTDPQFFTATIWIMPAEFGYWSTPELKFPELFKSPANNPGFAQKQSLTSNIPLATISEDKSLAVIFPFEFKETTAMLLFSEATLEAKLIITMYTYTKVEGQSIKLILDSSSAGCQVDQAASAKIIITDRATKTPISEIDDFPFKINGIITSIKVLVMEATQYQALIGNNWLSQNIQELQLTYQGQHICVPAMCGHFKTPPREKLLIELKKEKEKPTWKAYQVSWADSDNSQSEPTTKWSWKEKEKEKEREEELTLANELTYVPYTYQPPAQYH